MCVTQTNKLNKNKKKFKQKIVFIFCSFALSAFLSAFLTFKMFMWRKTRVFIFYPTWLLVIVHFILISNVGSIAYGYSRSKVKFYFKQYKQICRVYVNVSQKTKENGEYFTLVFTSNKNLNGWNLERYLSIEIQWCFSVLFNFFYWFFVKIIIFILIWHKFTVLFVLFVFLFWLYIDYWCYSCVIKTKNKKKLILSYSKL